MPSCPDDRYPMIPVRETAAGQIRWGCSNPWHPRDPGPCPNCGYPGRHRTVSLSLQSMARCPQCWHQWLIEGASAPKMSDE